MTQHDGDTKTAKADGWRHIHALPREWITEDNKAKMRSEIDCWETRRWSKHTVHPSILAHIHMPAHGDVHIHPSTSTSRQTDRQTDEKKVGGVRIVGGGGELGDGEFATAGKPER